MSGPAFEALSQKRMKIAAELTELERKVNSAFNHTVLGSRITILV
jgi:hypothetical protein